MTFRHVSRTFSTMSSLTTSSPFTRAVVSSMRKLYPESLADKSFDNTGLLLEAPFDSEKKPRLKNSVLLTIDLTTKVADEAIEGGDSVIVTYHPIIFRGLKSLTLANSQQRSLLRLAAAGISVYSPHTAVDAAPGGNADWLADIVTRAGLNPREPAVDYPGSKEAPPKVSEDFQNPTYKIHHFPLHRTLYSNFTTIPHARSAVTPDPIVPDAGKGRIVRFQTPQSLSIILSRLGGALCWPRAFTVAIPQTDSGESTSTDAASISVSSIAICAGSGGSVFNELKEKIDLLITGELSHHEALAAVESGTCVVALMHSNSERGYLWDVMRHKLYDTLRREWEAVRQEGGKGTGEEGVSLRISQADRDPFGFAVLTH